MSPRFPRFLTASGLLALVSSAGFAQTPIPRATPPAGSIIAAKGGEELRFVREGDWRAAVQKQDLLGGDTLRTNSIGNLAILFADQTQIRVGRNSTLIVDEVASAAGTTQLELTAGNVWARAARGGSGVDVRTPAAVAAVRGTDWSLSVDGAGKTALIVLEGVVELKNAQGSVAVHQGEGAVAAIGQAPTKFVLVSPNDREQMLFYLTLRDAFLWLPATPLKGPGLRSARARIETVPPASRKVEDWLTLAETALALDGRAVAAAALGEARRHRLTRAQQARAELIAGLIAAAERRFAEAAGLFARAERGLDASRRATAVYAGYIAASLAEPSRVQPEPKLRTDDATAALAKAYITGFRQDLEAAAREMKAVEKRFPQDARVAVFSAQLAFALNRREEMRAALDRARAIDADDPDVLMSSATVRAEIDGDIKGSLAELRKAAAIAPGQSGIWNGIGLLESERDAPLEAEAAFRRAIEMDPDDPVAYANLAIHLLDQSRVEEAGALVERALAIDPAFHVGQIARGRYLLQKGDMAGAIEAILSGSAANPAYSQGLLATAIAYYQNGDVELADQALDNADRLDPNDSIIAIVRTAIALDQYRADEAVLSAREAVRRSRARGGDYAGLAVSRQSGSYPVEAYRFINLNEWARYYGDRTYDPFAASSYFDQASVTRPNVLNVKPTLSSAETGAEADVATFNLLIQGLMFDPLAVSGRIGRIDLVRRPFLDTEIGGGVINQEGKIGWQTDASVQGFVNAPVPTSFSLTAGRIRANGPLKIDQERLENASFFIGAAPSADDRFLVYATASELKPGPIEASGADRSIFAAEKTTALQLGAGWSHTLGFQNVVTAALYLSRGDTQLYDRRIGIDLANFALLDIVQQNKQRADGAVAALNHTVGFGDLTMRYGLEAQAGDTRFDSLVGLTASSLLAGTPQTVNSFDRAKGTFQGGRLYADAFWRPSDRFEAQVGLQGTLVDLKSQSSDSELGPRAGIAVSPLEGQWLRAAYRSDAQLPLPFSLSPVTTVGLIPNALPIALGGRTETFALRWDAEWSAHVFTALEYQHQDIRNLDLPIAETFDTLSIGEAKVDRVAATANLWLGYGIGVFGTVGAAASEVREGLGVGRDVPYVPGRFARAGLTFVHPSRVKFTMAQTFNGDLAGDLTGQPLKDYWTTEAAVSWETPDRHLLFEMTVLNLFDLDYELAPHIPGPGRTVAASLHARF